MLAPMSTGWMAARLKGPEHAYGRFSELEAPSSRTQPSSTSVKEGANFWVAK